MMLLVHAKESWSDVADYARQLDPDVMLFPDAPVPVVSTSEEDAVRIRSKFPGSKIATFEGKHPFTGFGILSDPITVRIGNVPYGGAEIPVIAGPCSIESEPSFVAFATELARRPVGGLRGGIYKPRTSPYSFQGLEDRGFEALESARDRVGLPIISEVMSPYAIPDLEPFVDAFQVGARNMQNFALLKALSATRTPVVLKRGFGCTTDELLHAAEYLIAGGNTNVILCERGIRTFEKTGRYTLDLGSVIWLKANTRLPVIVDPSHAIGDPNLIPSGALAAIAAGADGLMVEVHPLPAEALSDGEQALTLEQFDEMIERVKLVAKAVGRSVYDGNNNLRITG